MLEQRAGSRAESGAEASVDRVVDADRNAQPAADRRAAGEPALGHQQAHHLVEEERIATRLAVQRRHDGGRTRARRRAPRRSAPRRARAGPASGTPTPVTRRLGQRLRAPPARRAPRRRGARRPPAPASRAARAPRNASSRSEGRSAACTSSSSSRSGPRLAMLRKAGGDRVEEREPPVHGIEARARRVARAAPSDAAPARE